MSYPAFWMAIVHKFKDFKADLKHNSHGRKAFRITIEHRHKRFRDNKRRSTLDLDGPEMERIVEKINNIIEEEKIELLKKTEDYEGRERTNTLGELDT